MGYPSLNSIIFCSFKLPLFLINIYLVKMAMYLVWGDLEMFMQGQGSGHTLRLHSVRLHSV